MVTRFVPAGYQPQWAGESTVDRVTRAVSGLGELIDDYEFHYPQEIDESNLLVPTPNIYAVASRDSQRSSVHGRFPR